MQNTHSKEEGKGGNYSLENASLLKSNLYYIFFAPQKAHGFRYLLKSNPKPKDIWKSVKLISVMSKVPKFEKLFSFCPNARWRLMQVNTHVVEWCEIALCMVWVFCDVYIICNVWWMNYINIETLKIIFKKFSEIFNI